MKRSICHLLGDGRNAAGNSLVVKSQNNRNCESLAPRLLTLSSLFSPETWRVLETLFEFYCLLHGSILELTFFY